MKCLQGFNYLICSWNAVNELINEILLLGKSALSKLIHHQNIHAPL
jgi:hypothetical protein